MSHLVQDPRCLAIAEARASPDARGRRLFNQSVEVLIGQNATGDRLGLVTVPYIYQTGVRDSGGSLVDRYHLPNQWSAEEIRNIRIPLPFADC